MRRNFLFFIAVVLSILGTAAYYLGTRFTTRFDWAYEHAGAVWIILAVVVALQIATPILYRSRFDANNRMSVLHWISYLAFGFFTCLLFYTVAADITTGILGLFVGHAQRYALEQFGLLAAAGVTAISVGVGMWEVLHGPRIFEVEVPLKNLPAAFDGYRIVQISDLHVGSTIGIRYVRRVVGIANALKADAVALTGDMIDGRFEPLRPKLAPLAELKSVDGTFYVLGNHEFYWHAPTWLDFFPKLGVKPLVNEHVVIQRDGAKLVIAGVTDFAAGRMVEGLDSDPAKAIKGAPADTVKVLLAHQPKSFEAARAAGFDLQLSGHTHGGQFFPWSLVVAAAQPFNKGLARAGSLWVYVNRGTGYWGPPIRFLVPSEITLLKLRISPT